MVPALCEGSSPGTRADAQCAGTCAPQRARMCQPSALAPGCRGGSRAGRALRRGVAALGRACACGASCARLCCWGALPDPQRQPGFAWQNLVPGCILILTIFRCNFCALPGGLS